jgi:hypothetical protein
MAKEKPSTVVVGGFSFGNGSWQIAVDSSDDSILAVLGLTDVACVYGKRNARCGFDDRYAVNEIWIKKSHLQLLSVAFLLAMTVGK